jgi:hypothetical protein
MGVTPSSGSPEETTRTRSRRSVVLPFPGGDTMSVEHSVRPEKLPRDVAGNADNLP